MTLAVAVEQNSLTGPQSDSRQHLTFGDSPTRVTKQMPSGNDDAATLQTLDLMSRIACRTSADPIVQAAAAVAIAGLAPDACARDKASAIWQYVRSRVRFVQDDELYAGAREVLIEPPRLLTASDPQGDCDDFTMCVMTLCLAAGVPCRAIAVAADPEAPERLSHVFAQAIIEDGSAFPIDASHGPYAGWSAPRIYRRIPWTLLQPDCNAPRPPRFAACALLAVASAIAAWSLFGRF